MGHSRPLSLYFRLFNTFLIQLIENKICRWLDYLVSKATNLPTEQQSLPNLSLSQFVLQSSWVHNILNSLSPNIYQVISSEACFNTLRGRVPIPRIQYTSIAIVATCVETKYIAFGAKVSSAKASCTDLTPTEY